MTASKHYIKLTYIILCVLSVVTNKRENKMINDVNETLFGVDVLQLCYSLTNTVNYGISINPTVYLYQ